jgi:hypothetical protein
MREYRINEQCIIGMPSCGYGFGSSRMCFMARPSDGEFQLEEDILRQALKERNYDIYVALQQLDPGNFAFCTKICSKIITSHFCIVLLNQSPHRERSDIKIPNPNVHLEYGMMLSFHKHIIPMQPESEILAFNIYPLDTLKYRPENFKTKVELAVDDAILRFKTKEPPGRPIGPASEVLKYMSFRGLRYTDITTNEARTLFNLGAIHGFNLFDGQEEVIFYGYFHEEEPREIVVRVKFLLNNIAIAYRQVQELAVETFKELAKKVLDRVMIEVLVPENAPIDVMAKKIEDFQPQVRHISVILKKPSDIEKEVKRQYKLVSL